jgi:tripartite ATP-independent transporter DctP family solute receptor
MRKLIVTAFMLIAFHQHVAAQPSKTGDRIELRLAHVTAVGSLYDLTAHEFARRVREELRGKVNITVFPNSELGNDIQLIEKVRRGELDFSMSAQAASAISPMFSVFDVPYVVLTRQRIRSIRETLVRQYFQPAAHEQGLVILGMWENGFRHITNNVRPIQTPEDLKGLKIRVPQGSLFLTALKIYGAAPAEYPFGPPLIEALKAGMFDGQENAFSQIRSFKLDTVQKYLSLTYHNYVPAWLVANEAKIAALPADVQAAIRKAGADLQDWSMNKGEQLDIEARWELSRTMSVNEIDTYSFLSASLPAHRQFAADVPQGRDLIRLLYDRTITGGANRSQQ